MNHRIDVTRALAYLLCKLIHLYLLLELAPQTIMLFGIQLSNRFGGFRMGQVPRFGVYLLQAEQFLLLEFNRASLVFDQPLLLLLNELSLLFKFCLEGLNCLLVKFTLGLHRLSLLTLFASDFVLFLLYFVLKDLFGAHHLEHTLLRLCYRGLCHRQWDASRSQSRSNVRWYVHEGLGGRIGDLHVVLCLFRHSL